MRRIAIAQIQSGFWWRSEDKVDCLQAHLSGRALRHFQTQSPEWMRESPHLEFVMLKLLNAFTVKLTLDQAADIFRRPKPKNRAWNEHYIYLTETSEPPTSNWPSFTRISWNWMKWRKPIAAVMMRVIMI
jgi:hypothetical protein